MTAPDYHLGDKAKAAIGTTTIKGLNKLRVPGIVRGSIKVEEFDRDFDFEVPTSASWESGSMSGNYVRDDSTGQRALRSKLFSNTGMNNLRLYENATDFWAPDLANDENSKIFVKGMPGPDISKSGLIPFSVDLLVQGLIALFDAHITATTIAFVVAGETKTITDSGSGFVTAGFEVGYSLIVEGSASNDDVHMVVTAVEAGTLTVSVTSGTFAEGTAGDSITIHGGSL